MTGRCRHEHHAQPTGIGSLAACGYISYGDARQTSGNTNAFEGKLLRIRPVTNPAAGATPGIGTTYTIPGPDAPNGPNLFPPTSQAVLDGKAKPEIFAMGVRNLYSIDVDDKTEQDRRRRGSVPTRAPTASSGARPRPRTRS